jgi:4-carboxymuconolactone decarboxylase
MVGRHGLMRIGGSAEWSGTAYAHLGREQGVDPRMDETIPHVPAPRVEPLPKSPRVPAVSRTNATEEQAALLKEIGEANIYATMAHRPDILRTCVPLGPPLRLCSDEPREAVRGGKMRVRDRELLIHRTARRCGSDYELSQHYRISLAWGISQEELDRIADGPDAVGWDPFDRALLRAADELHDHAMLSQRTWDTLSTRYDTEELIQVVMLCGYYHMLAYLLNTAGVQL